MRVIEHFLSKSFSSHDEQVAYFYCSKASGSGSMTVDILCSLVRQLAWSTKGQRIEESVMAHWEHWQYEPDPKPPRLDLGKCKCFLKKILLHGNRVTIIVDALDECADPKEFINELQALKEICIEAKSALKVFISSRDEVMVADQLGQSICQELRVSPEATAQDLLSFITCKIDYERNKKDNKHPLKLNDRLCQRTIKVLAKAGKGA
jgi:hypothetical protein